MLRRLGLRITYSLISLLVVSIIAFFLVFLTGDPAALMLPMDAPMEEVERFRELMGFNDPLHVQYLRFLGGAVRGDFGNSLRYNEPALPIVVSKIPATVELVGAAEIITLLLGFSIGISSAIRYGSRLDSFALAISSLGQSMPVFWSGILLILVFSIRLRWLPPSGYGSFSHVILPALSIAIWMSPRLIRLVRTTVREVMGQDYIAKTARGKGLPEKTIILRHSLRNAMIPLVTIIGLDMGSIFGGAVITETIFAWPGLGQLLIKAVQSRDFPLVQAVVIVIAVMFILINLVVDILYTYLDPRIRLE